MVTGGNGSGSYGTWRVRGTLGAGGMGIVYDAVDSDGRRAALKVINPGLAEDPVFRTRFRREIEVSRRVSGTRTAAVLDAEPDSTPPWLATEFVEGRTLGEVIEDAGPITGEALTSLAVALLQALEEIHAAGVVHRDLKPSNVILTADTPKVIDFGIAVAAEATSLTATGAFIGSAGWMSPEQVQGGEVTAAADVFSWAALIAYAATATRPFGDGRPEALAYRVVHEAPNLAAVPGALRPVLAAALRVDPARRPTVGQLLAQITGEQDATAVVTQGWALMPATVVHALDAAVHSGTRVHDIPAPGEEREPARRRQWWWPVAVAAVVALAIASAAYGLTRDADTVSSTAITTTTTAEASNPTTTTTAVPTTTTSSPTTAAPVPSFAGVDWLNRAYDLDCAEGNQRYELLDGQYSSLEAADPSVRFDEVWIGSYDPHPGEEAVVTVACAFGAGAVINQLLVFEPTDLGPRRVGGGALTDGFFALEDGSFVLYEPEYSPGDPACCPSFYERRLVTIDTQRPEGAYPSGEAAVLPTERVPFPEPDF